MKRVPPQPWTLSFQTSPTGRRSRFVVKDANGRPVAKVFKESAAGVVVMAATMEIVLQELRDTAGSWRIMLSKEFGHNVTCPAIEKADEVLAVCRRSRY